MTNTNLRPADALRVALKAAGFNARRVSVRADHSTLRVTVRDASVSLTQVAAIANAFEVVRRDHASGEILCGGNTFVEVEYDAAIVAPIKAAILAVLEQSPDDESLTIPGGYRVVKVTRERGATYFDEVRIWGPGFDEHSRIAVGVAFAAKRIAIAHLDASASASAAMQGSAVVTTNDFER
jgi:hypothetical protein